jgi:hypothetical protein
MTISHQKLLLKCCLFYSRTKDYWNDQAAQNQSFKRWSEAEFSKKELCREEAKPVQVRFEELEHVMERLRAICSHRTARKMKRTQERAKGAQDVKSKDKDKKKKSHRLEH